MVSKWRCEEDELSILFLDEDIIEFFKELNFKEVEVVVKIVEFNEEVEFFKFFEVDFIDDEFVGVKIN